MSFILGIERLDDPASFFLRDGSFTPKRFSYVNELHVYHDELEPYRFRNPKLELVLIRKLPTPQMRIRLRFSGVNDFSADELIRFGIESSQIMGFNISDISDRNWQDLRIWVTDYEDEIIEFYAWSCEIIEFGPHTPMSCD